MTELLRPNSISVLLILIFSAILPGCSESDTPRQTSANNADQMLGPRAMGLPPFGSTYEEFLKALPETTTLSLSGKPGDKAFEVSPPQIYDGDIKTARLVAQFKLPEATTERYWQLVAVTKLPWVCGSQDLNALFEREEPMLKTNFEFTQRSTLSNGRGAVLSGVSRHRMLMVHAECMDAPIDSTIFIKYQLIDPNLFAYVDGGPKRVLDEAYAKRPK